MLNLGGEIYDTQVTEVFLDIGEPDEHMIE